jgi:hypothetical protein
MDVEEFPAGVAGSVRRSVHATPPLVARCSDWTEITVTTSELKQQVEGLAHKRTCPRCDFDKTWGSALCRKCRNQLPEHMRIALERIPQHDAWTVVRALRAAANYLDVHFQSIRNFGGGKKRR